MADEVDTLGGYLVTRAGRLPVRGELIPGPDLFEFEVLDADPRRIKRAKIYRRKDRRPAVARDVKTPQSRPAAIADETNRSSQSSTRLP
ncbi:MAG: transporter associated domain-containing protein [Stellaceae bacterium]